MWVVWKLIKVVLLSIILNLLDIFVFFLCSAYEIDFSTEITIPVITDSSSVLSKVSYL